MVVNGAGPRRAAAATREALSRVRADAVVSFGFCGALDPLLAVGDVFVATEVEGGGERFPAAMPHPPGPHASGLVASRTRVASTAAEKSTLRATGASVVEMEAAGVARESRRSAVPFYCVRAVTDLAGEDFALDLNAAMREDGHFDTMILLKLALRRPGSALPELFRLRGRCRVAAKKLGEFFVHCRF
jgi:adenosylhomocysteine nucleosidase